MPQCIGTGRFIPAVSRGCVGSRNHPHQFPFHRVNAWAFLYGKPEVAARAMGPALPTSVTKPNNKHAATELGA